MRRLRARISVQTNAQLPSQLNWEGRTLLVKRVLNGWRYGGRWWLGETIREYFQLELEDRSVVDLFRDEKGWVLSCISD